MVNNCSLDDEDIVNIDDPNVDINEDIVNINDPDFDIILDSIRNSCNVFTMEFITLLNFTVI